MADHPIQGLMKTALESLQSMVDVGTIVGDPIETEDGHTIITLSKVGFGFVAGGSEFNTKNENPDEDPTEETEAYLPFGGGTGGGVSITPIAFLIIGDEGVKTIHLDNNTHLYERLIDLAPQTIERIKEILEKSGSGNSSKRKKRRSEWNDEE
ncbi:GerW family sporulation protein [Sporolactobacillus terrae]|uniref:Putative spore protein YtfJ n=1 Tax=Sporolactobacillus terrae TaxID=269673 RepID=A0A410DAC2_9BACL|nr:GerW family sporulation protein [Sporolactobacillus terrae]QAA23025.1 sporulation protein YtfJ [Sporolactobacillus terrae]QAA25998.1 sporulation protein YtfJ [Sporolactobacillus terrae]UAK15092.1 GerW family sporulation protein [Sporolactobacillus terrae]BBN99435.1 putative spore protein YtfJ [Sporolactobacillus terrae]